MMSNAIQRKICSLERDFKFAISKICNTQPILFFRRVNFKQLVGLRLRNTVNLSGRRFSTWGRHRLAGSPYTLHYSSATRIIYVNVNTQKSCSNYFQSGKKLFNRMYVGNTSTRHNKLEELDLQRFSSYFHRAAAAANEK